MSSDWHESLTSPSGEVFHRVGDELLTAQEALSLVESGAWVMIDSCGDGCVGIDWLSDRERRDVAKRGMTLSRNGYGRFQRWESHAGQVAVFVDGGDLRR
jgi:hypothetical protein